MPTGPQLDELVLAGTELDEMAEDEEAQDELEMGVELDPHADEVWLPQPLATAEPASAATSRAKFADIVSIDEIG